MNKPSIVLILLCGLASVCTAPAHAQELLDNGIEVSGQRARVPSASLARDIRAQSTERARQQPFNRRAQIRQLRREGILRDYDATNDPTKSLEQRILNLQNRLTSSSVPTIRKQRIGPSRAGLSKEQPALLVKTKTFQDNFRREVQTDRPTGLRVWKGKLVKDIKFHIQTVLLKGPYDPVTKELPICTGTLITPRLVLTAAHCYCYRTITEVTFGLDTSIYHARREIDRKGSTTNIECDKLDPQEVMEKHINTGDVALFRLSKSITSVTPRKIATEQQVQKAKSLRAVGFGLTDEGTLEKKFEIDLIVASPDCKDLKQEDYACAAELELIAGGMDQDTCGGDSGGPVFVRVGKSFYQAGVTSRSIRPTSDCGEGGIYVKLTNSKIRDWLVANGVPRSAFLK